MVASPANPPATGSRRLVALLVVLLPVCVLLGFVLHQHLAGIHAAGPGGVTLPAELQDQLRRLNGPVEIRFYSVLPPDSAPQALRDFSGRVDQILSAIQSLNEQRIQVVRKISTADVDADAAAADGVEGFNRDKGGACYLGVAVVSGGRKESLARLQPEWEPALPFDLARAILRVTAAASPPVARPSPAISSEVTNAVRRLIPDIGTTSLEEGTQILRAAAVQELTAAGAEANRQVELAKQQLAEAQNGGSEAAQQAAQKNVEQVQLEQAEKVRAIAARLQQELDIWQQLKAAATPAR